MAGTMFMPRRIWFGNRRKMQWIKPWVPNPASPRLGFRALNEWTSGGASVETSLDTAGDYTLEWRGEVDEMEFMHAYANGRYGRELMYWTDPMYAARNVLPARWASPWIASDDGIPLIRSGRPVAVDNSDTSLDYPEFGARYTFPAGAQSSKLMIPIPPGYTAHIGVHGDADVDGMVIATPYEKMTAGTPVALDRLAVNSTTRVNESFASSGSTPAAQSWVELKFDTTAGDTITPIGLIAQILKTGVTPATGGFIEGMGHSGCSIHTVTPQPISAGLDRAAVVARLVESGSWKAYL